MKLSKRTIGILKNFATINQSILIRPGNTISTISNLKDIFAKTKVDETFDIQISIYDINEFLNTLSLFEDPELTFEEKRVVITQGKQTYIYHYCDPSIITAAPDKDGSLPSSEVTAQLSKEQLQSLMKSMSLLEANVLSFVNGSVEVKGTSNRFKIDDVASVEESEDYKLSISVERLKMIPDDYQIEICVKGLAKFTGVNQIMYITALESDGHYKSNA